MYIGIDPDKDKSGLAVFTDNSMTVSAVNIVNLSVFLKDHASDIKQAYLEAGWLNKSLHRHAANKNLSAKMGRDVGVNIGFGLVIEQFLSDFNIPYSLVQPTGKTRKVNQHQFKKITGYSKRNNQEMRDAAMLVLRAKGNDALKGVDKTMYEMGVLK